MPQQTPHDQTVKVTFTPPNTFVFNPPDLSMGAAGKILMHQEPSSADWTFVSVNELPAQFTSSVTGNGQEIAINDGHTSNGSWHYTVTVHDASGDHTSTNQATQTALPMITNQ